MNEPWTRRDTITVAALATLHLILCVVLAACTNVCGDDSGRYVTYAREIPQGLIYRCLQDSTHPVYPMAIWVLASVIGDYGAAGYAISILFGSLALLPYYAFVRELAGRAVATLSLLFFACLPWYIESHADVMTEGLFDFLYLSGIYLLWVGVTRERFVWMLGAALVGGLAYLTRTEGIYVGAMIVALPLMQAVADRFARRPVRWRAIAYSALAFAAFLATCFPMFMWYRRLTGIWTFTNRGSVASVVRAITGVEPQMTQPDLAEPPKQQVLTPSPPPPGKRGWIWSIHSFRKDLFHAGFHLTPILAFLGFFLWRAWMKPFAAFFLLCLAAGYAGPPVLAHHTGYALAVRYLLLSLAAMLPFAAVAILFWMNCMQKRWKPRVLHGVVATFLAIFCIAGAARGYAYRVADRQGKLDIKYAALWVRDNAPADVRIRCNHDRFWYYLGRRTAYLPMAPHEVWRMNLQPGEWLLVMEDRLRTDAPAALLEIQRRSTIVRRFDDSQGRLGWPVGVYRVNTEH